MGDFWHACMNLLMESGGGLMVLVPIVFWIVVAVLLVLGVRWLFRQGAAALSLMSPAADSLRRSLRRTRAAAASRWRRWPGRW